MVAVEQGGESTIQVKVRVYAGLRRHLPNLSLGESAVISVAAGTTIGDLLDRLAIPRAEVKTSFVNGIQRPLDNPLQESDEVAFFPPIAGGR